MTSSTAHTPKPSKRKRLDVMISSTSKDLPLHRAKATDAILNVGMHPLRMEDLAAQRDDAIAVSLAMVDEAEVYIGIFGYRYGYIPDDSRNPGKVSITELEYRRAIERGIAVLIFLMHEDHPAPDTSKMNAGQTQEAMAQFFEQSDEGKKKLKELKEELGKNHIRKEFKDEKELGNLIAVALANVIQDERWLEPTGEKTTPSEIEPVVVKKTFLAKPPKPHYHTEYLLLTTNFVGRKRELNMLDEWAASRDGVFVFDAIGGMGKSAVTWYWVKENAQNVMNPSGVFWWSFYEQGATMYEFLRYALAYMQEKDPDSPELLEMKYHMRVKLVLDELRRDDKKYLFVLDGFERVLMAYNNIEADRQKDTDLEEERPRLACIDPQDDDFLTKWRNLNHSKILVSTRLMPKVLINDAGEALPNIRHVRLTGLAPDDAHQLMADNGVRRADTTELNKFMAQFGYHPLVLKVVASQIAHYAPAPRDFDQWYEIEGRDISETLINLRDSKRNEFILERSLKYLREDLSQLLGKIALFGDAVDHDRLQIFNTYMPPEPPRPELTPIPNALLNPFGSRKMADLQLKLNNTLNRDEKTRLEQQIEQQETADETERQSVENSPPMLEVKQGVALRKRREEWKRAEKKRMQDIHVQTAYHLFKTDLDQLRELGLLQFDSETVKYDLHPLVRAVAYNLLPEDIRTSAHEAIISVLDDEDERKKQQEKKVKEVKDIQESIEKYKAMLFAGRVKKAAAYFRRELCDTIFYELGDNYALIKLLEPIFGVHSEITLPQIAPDDASYLRHYLALSYSNLLETDKAANLFSANLEEDILHLRDGSNMVATLYCYATTSNDRDRLAETHRVLELALGVAEAVQAEGRIAESKQQLMELWTTMGKFEEAYALHEEIKESDGQYRKWLFETRLTYGLANWQIRQGMDASDALEKHTELVQKHNMQGSSSGNRYLKAVNHFQQGRYPEALEDIREAIKLLRSIGRPDAAAMSWLARIQATVGEFEDAQVRINATLNTSHDLSDRAQISANVAHTYLLMGKKADAKQYALKAYKEALSNGVPYVRWYELQSASGVLNELGESLPAKKTYVPTEYDSPPLEDAVKGFIEDVKQGKVLATGNTSKEQEDFIIKRIQWLHVGTIASFGLGEEYEPLLQRVSEEFALLSNEPTWTNMSYVGESVPEPSGYLTGGVRNLWEELRLTGVDKLLLDQFFLIIYIQSTNQENKPVYVYANVRGDRLERLLTDGENNLEKNIKDYATIVQVGDAPPTPEIREKLRRDYLFGEHFTNLRIFLDSVDQSSKGTTRKRNVAQVANQQAPFTMTKFTGFHVGTIASFGIEDEDLLRDTALQLASLSDEPGLVGVSYVGEPVTEPSFSPAYPHKTPLDELRLTPEMRRIFDKLFIICYVTSTDEQGNENFAWINIRGDRLENLFNRDRIGTPFNIPDYTTVILTGQGKPNIEQWEKLERDYLFGTNSTNLRIFFDSVTEAGKGEFRTRQPAEDDNSSPQKQPSFTLSKRERLHIATIAFFGIDDEDLHKGLARKLASLGDVPQWMTFSKMGENVPTIPDVSPAFTSTVSFTGLELTYQERAVLSKAFLIIFVKSQDENGNANFAWVNTRGDRLSAFLERLEMGEPFDSATYSTLVMTGESEPNAEQLIKLENDYLAYSDRTTVRIFPPLEDVT